MKLETRVFELLNEKYGNLSELARAMEISVSQVYRVREGSRGINESFIIGAMKAFPEYKLDNLFYCASDGNQNKPAPKSKAMMTISQAAQLLRVHPNTLRRWSNQGILKSYRVGQRGDRRFRREDLAGLLKEAKIE